MSRTVARWSGPDPCVGDLLRTSKTIYVIDAVRSVKTRDGSVKFAIEMTSMGSNNDETLMQIRTMARNVLAIMIHEFRWDSRIRRTSHKKRETKW